MYYIGAKYLLRDYLENLKGGGPGVFLGGQIGFQVRRLFSGVGVGSGPLDYHGSLQPTIW